MIDNVNFNTERVQDIDTIIAKLSVPYNDYEVLKTNSKELELVNYYFDSISCHNKEIERLLFEVIGYSLTKTSIFAKSFIFKGKGRNGKSKIFRILEALLGDNQCSHEHLEQISGTKSGSKSSIEALYGCTVNIAEDQKQPKYINTSYIKNIISGEPISIEQKGIERFKLIPYATMLFSVNEVIDFKETGLAITDRFVVIPFNATFTDDNNNRNINIGEELCQPLALQIIATKAIEAFKEAYNRGKFTIPFIVEQETNKYFMKCNNVAEFCKLFPIKTFVAKTKYYKEYTKWCNSNNVEAVSNNVFGERVLEFGYRGERYSFGGKRNNYYVNFDFDNSESRTIYNQYVSQCGISEESISKYTEEELITIFNATPFNDYLCDNLYIKNNNADSN